MFSQLIRSGLAIGKPFDSVIEGIRAKAETNKATNITEIKQTSKKVKGQLFEQFCLECARLMFGGAWLIHDLPIETRKGLNLPSQDKGIDIVACKQAACVKDGTAQIVGQEWYAIQCKYRNPNPKYKHRSGVTWDSLSTFYALCARTGPVGGWCKRIVMTNCHYVASVGVADKKDMIMDYTKFSNLPREFWSLMAGTQPGQALSTDHKTLTKQEMMEQRANKLTRSALAAARATTLVPRFNYEPRTKYLINKNNSYVYLIREWIDAKYATQLLEKLSKEVKWEQAILIRQGKEVLQPSYSYRCGDCFDKVTYYPGTTSLIHPWIEEVRLIRDRVVSETWIWFDTGLLRKYRDGNDYITPHPDREALGKRNAVVCVSLGAPRDLVFTEMETGNFECKEEIRNGDGYIMYDDTQKNFKHSIPKVAGGKAARDNHGERISLTFRCLHHRDI